jgi:hypothetical protein
MNLKPFKFFQKKERVFSDWLDQLDDYHLGRIERYNRPINSNLYGELINAVQELSSSPEFTPASYVQVPIPPPIITEEDINLATMRGRQSYLNGDNLEVIPYLTPEFIYAFEQGWKLEEEYALLRQSRDMESDGL